MQDKIDHIESLYQSQLQGLNNWRDQAINAVYREHSQPIPPPSSPPHAIIPFGWKDKNEDRLIKLSDELLSLKFFKEEPPTHYKKIFRPHFIIDENTLIINQLKCERNFIELVWVFCRLQYFNAISSKHDLKILLPQHFLNKKGEKPKDTVINTYLTRIRKKIYQPDPDFEWQINSIFQ